MGLVSAFLLSANHGAAVVVTFGAQRAYLSYLSWILALKLLGFCDGLILCATLMQAVRRCFYNFGYN